MNLPELGLIGLALGQVIHALFHLFAAGMGIHEVYYHNKAGSIKAQLWKVVISVTWTILCLGLLLIDWHEHAACAIH